MDAISIYLNCRVIKSIKHKDGRFLIVETPQHQVGAVILLIYLNSQKGLEVLLSLPQERCIMFGNDNENIYKERRKWHFL